VPLYSSIISLPSSRMPIMASQVCLWASHRSKRTPGPAGRPDPPSRLDASRMQLSALATAPPWPSLAERKDLPLGEIDVL
jgi:hypothetical protein